MGKKVTYERWINLFLPNGWNEREEMGCVFVEKENWPGMLQITFIERHEMKLSPADAARMLLEDTLEERDIPFPREAVKVDDRGDNAIATLDYTYQDKEHPLHWRIWFLVDKTRAIMSAYVCSPEFDVPALDEAGRIVADIEFIPLQAD